MTQRKQGSKKKAVQGRSEKVQVNQQEDTLKSQEPSEDEGSEPEIYEVEKLVDSRKIKGKLHYLVRWSGYTEKDDTWEPSDNILDQDIVQEFEKAHEGDEAIKKRKGSARTPKLTKKQLVIEARNSRVLDRKGIKVPHVHATEKESECCSLCSSRIFAQAILSSAGKKAPPKKSSSDKETLITGIPAFDKANKEKAKVSSYKYGVSPDCPFENALLFGILDGNIDVVRALEFQCVEARAVPSAESIKGPGSGTGYLDRNTFRHAVKTVNESRGNREGNTAFYKYETKDTMKIHQTKYDSISSSSQALLDAIFLGKLDPGFIPSLMALSHEHSRILTGYGVYEAASAGDMAMVKRLLSVIGENEGFNLLHKEIVQDKLGKKPLSPYRSNQVIKKSIDNKQITPIHLAAIHPKVTYLERFADEISSADFLKQDGLGRTVAHFAAVANTPDCLTFLSKRNVAIDTMDSLKVTPIMLCAMYGKHKNLKVFISTLGENIISEKHTKFGWTPLHFAAHFGHTETVAKLLEYGALVDGQDRETKASSLHHSVRMGSLDMTKLLIETGGANPELLDKFGRSPLHLAAKNGRYDIAKYLLLEIGVDADAKDTSDNTPLHYAAAYGWFDLVVLLIDCGKADINAFNNWKTTPMAIADMKGHTRIVNHLLEIPSVKAAFKNQNGETLLHQYAVEQPLDWYHANRLIEKATCLVNRGDPDLSSGDIRGDTPLHKLASCPYYVKGVTEIPKDSNRFDEQDKFRKIQESNALFGKFDDESGTRIQIQLADLFLPDGTASLQAKNEAGYTPIEVAMEHDHIDMVNHLLNQPDSNLLDCRYGQDKNNVMHFLLNQISLVQSELAKTDPENLAEKARLERYKTKIGNLWNLIKGSCDSDAITQLFGIPNRNGLHPIMAGLSKAYEVQKERLDHQGRRNQKSATNYQWDYLIQSYSDLFAAAHPNLNTKTELPHGYFDAKVPPKPQDEPNMTGWTPLHFASSIKELGLVKMLLEHGADPNCTSDGHNDGFSPLHLVASHLGHQMHQIADSDQPNVGETCLEILVSLVRKGGDMFSVPIPPKNNYKSKQALKFTDSAFMRVLLLEPVESAHKLVRGFEEVMGNDISLGASQRGNAEGLTPLMLAIQLDSVPKVQLVVSLAPDINVPNNDGATALMYALYKHSSNCQQIVSLILDSVTASSLDLDLVDKTGQTTLGLVGQYADSTLMNLFSNFIPAQLTTVDQPDDSGRTPLFWACRHNCPSVARKLILACADPNFYPTSLNTKTWMTPLMAALHYYNLNSLETVEVLLEAGADPNIANPEGRTAMHFAAIAQSYPITQTLLREGASVDPKDSLGYTPLHLSTLESLRKEDKTLKIESLLLSHGADINARNFQGRTPLHLCFSIAAVVPYTRYTEKDKVRAENCLKVMKEMKKQKSNIDVQLKSLGIQNSELSHCLSENRALPSFRSLDLAMQSQKEVDWFQQGPYRESTWETEFRSDFKDDPVDLITFFLEYPSLDINAIDSFGRAPLHYAARIGAFTCTKYLLDKNAKLQVADHDGITPFHMSLLHGHIDYTIVMFNRGVDGLSPMYLPKYVIISPFCFALSKSYMPLAYLLIEKKLGFIGAIKDTLQSGKFYLASTLLKNASTKDLLEIQAGTLHTLSHAIASFTPSNPVTWMEYLPDYLEKIKDLAIPTTLPDKDSVTPLILSVRNRQSTLAIKLIEADATQGHLNHVDSNKCSALWHAINNSMTDVALKLLEHKVAMDHAELWKLPSVLYLAVWNTPALVPVLIQLGANPNLDSIHGRRSAFMRTLMSDFPLATQDRMPLWNALVAANADINAPGPMDLKLKNAEPAWVLPPSNTNNMLIHNVHPSLLIKDLPLSTQAYFIENGLSLDTHHPIEGKCLLSYLKSKNHLSFYIKSGADLNLNHKLTGRSFLYELIMDDPLGLGEELINFLNQCEFSNPLKLNNKDPVTNVSPLEFAIRDDNLHLLQWLMRMGASPHYPTATQNPIVYSLIHNKPKAIEYLLEYAALTNSWEKWVSQDEFGRPHVFVKAVVLDEIASYQNSKVLKMILTALQSAGYNIDHLAHQSNGVELSAIQLAAAQFHPQLYQTFLELGCTPLTDDKMVQVRDPGIISNCTRLTLEKINSDADLAKKSLMAWHDEKHKDDKKEIPEEELVDPKSDLGEIGKLAKGKDGELLSVLMNRTQVESAYYSNNMFYKLQLIHNPVQDVYVLFTRWGSIGSDGMYQRTPFSDYEAGLKEFESVFKAKSGNSWDCRHPDKFTSRPGRFVLIKAAAPQHYLASFKKWRETVLPKSQLPTQLPFGISCVLGIFYQLTSMQYHTKSKPIPLGQRDSETIAQAHSLLQSIKLTLKEIDDLSAPGVAFDAKSLSLMRHKLIELNSQYFTLIPQASKDGLQPIINLQKWTSEALELEKLTYLQTGSNLLLASVQNATLTNPLDYCYMALGCQLQEVPAQDSWFSMVSKYMSQETTNYELVGLFKVHREEEEANFKPFEKIPGRKLLWHGSRVENYFGILSKGLQPAPIEAQTTGYMFGKGVYFADAFSKSVAYSVSHSEFSKGYRCLLLCEVAVGNPYSSLDQDFMLVPKDGFDSTKGIGNQCPDPEESVYLTDGTEVPLGKMIDSEEKTSRVNEEKKKHGYYYSYGSLEHNEYVVYDPHRVKMRALVLVKEKKSCHLCLNPNQDLSIQKYVDHPKPSELLTSTQAELAPLVPATSFNGNKLEQVLADALLRNDGFQDPTTFLKQSGLPNLILQSLPTLNNHFDPVVPLDPKNSKLCATCMKTIIDLAYQEYCLAHKERILAPFNQRPNCWYGFKCKFQSGTKDQDLNHVVKFNHICHPVKDTKDISSENEDSAKGLDMTNGSSSSIEDDQDNNDDCYEDEDEGEYDQYD